MSGLGPIKSEELSSKLSPLFDVDEFGEGAEAATAAWEFIEQSGDQSRIGFGTSADGKWIVASLRDDSRMDTLCPTHSPEWRALA